MTWIAGAGGALVCARRLHSWGAVVYVCLARPAARMSPVPAHQLEILRRMGVPAREGEAAHGDGVDLIVDGLIGYSLRGAPRGLTATLIRWANAHNAPVLALDIPSGVDATDGSPRDPAIRAAATLTLALPKTGLRAPAAEPFTGELYLADIGVPPTLYARPPLNLAVGPIFAASEIVRL